MVGSAARPSIMWRVSPTQNNRHYVRHPSWHRLRVGSILDLGPWSWVRRLADTLGGIADSE